MTDSPMDSLRTGPTKPASDIGAGERTLLEGLLHYVGIVWRYRMMVVIMTGVAIVGSVGFAVLSLALPADRSPLPNYYSADAMLLLSKGETQSVSAGLMSALGIDSTGGGLDYGSIAIEVLNNRSFLDSIVEANDVVGHYAIDQKVRTASRSVVLSNATFSYNNQTGILRIAYQDTDPKYAAQVADSMVNELLDWFAARGGSDKLVTLQTMKDKLQDVQSQISSIEAQIEEFQKTYGVLKVEEIAQTQTDLLAGFQSQLLQLDLQISNLESVSKIENDPEQVALRSQRQNLMSLMDRVKQGYTGGGDVLPPRDQLPALAAQYTKLQMDLEIQGRIYQALNEQYEVAKLNAGTDPAFTVLEPVEVPEEKSGPHRSQIVLVATALAFLGSIALGLILNGARNVAHDPDKMKLLTGTTEDTPQ